MIMEEVKIALVRGGSKLPKRATDGSVGYDVFASEVVRIDGNTYRVNLGFKMEMPDGWHAEVFPRSSLAKTPGWRLVNSVGVIDNDYRGEVSMVFRCDEDEVAFPYIEGDRCGQMLFRRSLIAAISEVSEEELSSTSRGEGGYGSTGK